MALLVPELMESKKMQAASYDTVLPVVLHWQDSVI